MIRFAHREAELHLVREDGTSECGLGGLPTLESEVADTNMFDDAGVDEATHAIHWLADWHGRVRPMDLVQVDLFDPEPFCAGAPVLLDDVRQRHQGEELRRDEHIIAMASDRAAHD